jgi:hypothetical protein
VGIASPRTPNLTGGLGVGYAFTEQLSGESGPHHRGLGTLAAAVQPLRFLSAALMFDGRFDKHPDDVLGSTSSTIGEPRLLLRAAEAIGRSLAAGGEVVLFMPGAQAPSFRPEATTLDAKLLGTYAPENTGVAIALNAGYRIDNTMKSVDRPGRVRPGDRLSLQFSDSDAVLLGIGASKRFGDVEALGEATWEVLVGASAPSAIESPLRLGAGARYHAYEGDAGNLQVELRSEVVLSGRPGNGPTEPFSPIEPRVAIAFGLRWVMPLVKTSKRTGRDLNPPGAITKPAEALGSVRGRVTAESGGPIPTARVSVASLEPNGGERSAEAAADGSFAIADLRPGPARVSVKAPGHDDVTQEVTIDARAPTIVDLVMKRTIKPGQLRGLVRSFTGKPLAATIRVEPIGVETKTDVDGTFQVDLPPGAYDVIVASPGFVGQRRPVQLEENGVTILNADLRPGL